MERRFVCKTVESVMFANNELCIEDPVHFWELSAENKIFLTKRNFTGVAYTHEKVYLL
jgi:hypothetical protein